MNWIASCTVLSVAALFAAACGGGTDERAAAIETVNRLFVATDNADWDALHGIFADEVNFDMTSLVGGSPAVMKARAITGVWQQGLAGLKVHHMAGNHMAQIEGNTATVFCYGVATHYLKNPTNNNIRTFAGSYDFGLIRQDGKWRVNRFKYNHKYLDGNEALHTYVKRAR